MQPAALHEVDSVNPESHPLQNDCGLLVGCVIPYFQGPGNSTEEEVKGHWSRKVGKVAVKWCFPDTGGRAGSQQLTVAMAACTNSSQQWLPEKRDLFLVVTIRGRVVAEQKAGLRRRGVGERMRKGEGMHVGNPLYTG